jgi:hypothetical protein
VHSWQHQNNFGYLRETRGEQRERERERESGDMRRRRSCIESSLTCTVLGHLHEHWNIQSLQITLLPPHIDLLHIDSVAVSGNEFLFARVRIVTKQPPCSWFFNPFLEINKFVCLSKFRFFLFAKFKETLVDSNSAEPIRWIA